MSDIASGTESSNEPVNELEEKMIESARAYIALGLKVFVLGNNKKPLANCVRCNPRESTYVHHDYDACDCLTCHGFYAATDDLDQFRRMVRASGGRHVGVRTGFNPRSGMSLVVFDAEAHADVKTGIEETGLEVIDNFEAWSGGLSLPDTLRSRSVSGGLHLYYVVRGGGDGGERVATVGRVLPAVDVKAEGGYVGAPVFGTGASAGEDAGRAWVNWGSVGLTELPTGVVAWLGSAEERRRAWRAGTASDGRERVGWDGVGGMDPAAFRAMQKEGPKAGHRDAFFNAYLYQLRREGKSKNLARDIVLDLWERAEQPPVAEWYMPWHDVEYKLERVWATVQPDNDVVDWKPWSEGLETKQVETVEELAAEIRKGKKSFKIAPSGFLLDGREAPTDDGDKERFVRLIGDKLRYVNAIETWYYWCQKYWEEVDSDSVMEMTKCVTDDIREMLEVGRDEESDDSLSSDDAVRWAKHAVKTESEGKKRAIIRLARGHKKIATRIEDFDTQKEVIVCQNGTLDLSKREFVASFDPSGMNTMIAGVSYDETAKSDELQAFLDRFIPGVENQDYFFKVMSSALIGGNPYRHFVVIKGGTSSGKSTISDAISNCLGTYVARINSSTFRGNLDDKPRADIVHNLTKRLAIADEGSPNWELHTDQVKRMTGGDTINARGMYAKKYLSIVPQFLPVIVTNVMPRVTEVDAALKRRLVVLEMDQILPENEIDTNYKDWFIKDPEILTALFMKLVRGYYAVQDNGIERPLSAEEANQKAMESLSNISEFISFAVSDGLLSIGNDVPGRSCIKTSDLHAMYMNWIMIHGDQKMQKERAGIKQFSQFLRDVMHWEVVRSNGTRWNGVVVLS